ncbi:uncharacterized protein BDR25DRAFT_350324 [Lindgomyces ingoldianus]|uniref:Uncharacterized protein n=1 Tax=Lindgomyces ingoldianus TaxID=673940 RepID=A0ACB6RAD8_9PLEO|nr:uncharacterized protein BDR25DRAFT_350324 [Lindgomyces ingoldianus]KAF2476057.1 hypothetical protein BDR25DRAFT_350324 [Lindgomyces ingoldianus]
MSKPSPYAPRLPGLSPQQHDLRAQIFPWYARPCIGRANWHCSISPYQYATRPKDVHNSASLFQLCVEVMRGTTGVWEKYLVVLITFRLALVRVRVNEDAFRPRLNRYSRFILELLGDFGSVWKGMMKSLRPIQHRAPPNPILIAFTKSTSVKRITRFPSPHSSTSSNLKYSSQSITVSSHHYESGQLHVLHLRLGNLHVVSAFNSFPFSIMSLFASGFSRRPIQLKTKTAILEAWIGEGGSTMQEENFAENRSKDKFLSIVRAGLRTTPPSQPKSIYGLQEIFPEIRKAIYAHLLSNFETSTPRSTHTTLDRTSVSPIKAKFKEVLAG